jgi:hypothetical protein
MIRYNSFAIDYMHFEYVVCTLQKNNDSDPLCATQFWNEPNIAGKNPTLKLLFSLFEGNIIVSPVHIINLCQIISDLLHAVSMSCELGICLALIGKVMLCSRA